MCDSLCLHFVCYGNCVLIRCVLQLQFIASEGLGAEQKYEWVYRGSSRLIPLCKEVIRRKVSVLLPNHSWLILRKSRSDYFSHQGEVIASHFDPPSLVLREVAVGSPMSTSPSLTTCLTLSAPHRLSLLTTPEFSHTAIRLQERSPSHSEEWPRWQPVS